MPENNLQFEGISSDSVVIEKRLSISFVSKEKL